MATILTSAVLALCLEALPASGYILPQLIGETADAASSVPDDKDIIVSGDRRKITHASVETEISESEILSRGAASIKGLLDQLSSEIRDVENEPILLINGKPAGFDKSILTYPAEALEGLAILEANAATQYGEGAGKRVVNLILKRDFSMLNAEASVGFPTAGGKMGLSLGSSKTAISGDTRWNVNANLDYESALFRNSRHMSRRLVDRHSFGVIRGIGGGEIDPNLSAALGRTIYLATFPLSDYHSSSELIDFAELKDSVRTADLDDFETLQPQRKQVTLSAGLTRPLGAFSASINVSANRTDSLGSRGLPMADFILPADHPASPFSNDVAISRPLSGSRPLISSGNSQSLGGTINLTGQIGRWLTNFSSNYSHAWTAASNQSAIDSSLVHQRIDDRDVFFYPFDDWNEDLLSGNRLNSVARDFNIRANVRRPLWNLSGGPVNLSVALHSGRNFIRIHDATPIGDHIRTSSFKRSQSGGQVSLSLPLVRNGLNGAPWMGDLTVNASAGFQSMTGSRLKKKYGANTLWSPSKSVQLRANYEISETYPTFDQLHGPVITTVSRVYDFIREEIAEPLLTSGGNLDLGRGTRTNLSLAAMIRPLGSQSLSLNFSYRQSTGKGGLSPFPELTPVTEEAFTDRITRDGDGRLIAIDARPLNIIQSETQDLTSGISFRMSQKGSEHLPRGSAQTKIRQIASPLNLTLTLNHRWNIKHILQIRREMPAIDQLLDTGKSTHSINFQASLGRKGAGINITGNWNNSANLKSLNTTGNGFFRYHPILTLGTTIFVEPHKLSSLAKKIPALNAVKITLDIHNLLDSYRRMTNADGSIPAGFSRYDSDPLGRNIKLSVRKTF